MRQEWRSRSCRWVRCAAVAAVALGWDAASTAAAPARGDGGAARPAKLTPYHADIAEVLRRSDDFRRVLFTGAKSQLVAMTLPPGGDIGTERHERVEQTFVFVSGTGRATVEGQAMAVGAGDVLVVPPGTTHQIVNAGREPLRLYTIYVPPNHIDGRVQHTKEDAERDREDEEFGRRVE